MFTSAGNGIPGSGGLIEPLIRKQISMSKSLYENEKNCYEAWQFAKL